MTVAKRESFARKLLFLLIGSLVLAAAGGVLGASARGSAPVARGATHPVAR